MSADGVPTLGVEEEFLLVDPGTRAPSPRGDAVVARAVAAVGPLVSGEFDRCQIEVRTPPLADAAALDGELRRVRAVADAAARQEGIRLCASGTAPVAGAPADGAGSVGDHPRYRAGVAQYRAMLDDFAISALHVHTHCPDREAAVLAANHLRPWLPLLVATAANSPYHDGTSTGYASWRAVVRGRFPCLGPPPYAESARAYDELAEAMARSEAVLEAGLPFWDVRPNPHHPTVEVRCMDVLPDVADTVALAALVRALVVDALERVRAGDPGPRVGAELLRAAYWRAARDGWEGAGVDALDGRVRSSAAQGARLLDRVGPVLGRYGDLERVRALFRRLDARGSGAERQRAAAARHGGVAGAVDDLVARTADGAREAR
ncbi:glutamate--cysteine ligase [Streptomyces sp. Z26]|uniref:carboxylate-amine ligase n=1 Tax=Streptomyces sp. Z26 TaxID=2500177 RepID=UPI0019CFA185|nr:glutamate--cysteine ligase [Streptomyces sp. Z26]